MHFVVYGAGAIGGVVAARLHQAGHAVTLIARGEHLRAIKAHGLVLESPDGTVTLPVPVVDDPSAVSWSDPVVVLVSVKSQDTDAVLGRLAVSAPPSTPVVCVQNAVANEHRVLRHYANTYGMCVMCPATHLEPGVVRAHSAPITGIMDLGRFPSGVDATARSVAEALRGATFDAEAIPDVMRWKYRKLLVNLANAVEALCGPAGLGSELAKAAYLEGRAVLEAAGIPHASREEDAARRDGLLSRGRAAAPGSPPWHGSSSWQSVVRGAGSIESDYLNGEIVYLGRLHAMVTPVNALLQLRAAELAARREPPGELDPDDLLAEARREGPAGAQP